LIEIQGYEYSDIISYILKLAWCLLWQITAPIRYEFWSYNGNSLYIDYYSLIYTSVSKDQTLDLIISIISVDTTHYLLSLSLYTKPSKYY